MVVWCPTPVPMAPVKILYSEFCPLKVPVDKNVDIGLSCTTVANEEVYFQS